MPITIKPSQLKYKDPSTSQYVSVAAVADLSALPIATTSIPGLIKASGYGSGLQLDSSGYLKLSYPGDSTIKAGTNLYAPVVVGLQHKSVFYGLAAAAGDTTQASSSNAVGTYTFGAQTAIQNMLGVPAATDAIFSGTFTLGGRAQGDIGQNSICFGASNIAASGGSFTLGYGNEAYGASSQAIGAYCKTLGGGATAFGYYSTAEYNNSFIIGSYNYLYATKGQWISGTSYNIDDIVNYNGAIYKCIEANSDIGSAPNASKWSSLTHKLFVIGNGDANNNRSNGLTLDINGKLSIKDYIYVGANADGSGGTRLPHDIQINGTSIVSNGVANIPIASYDNLGLVKANAMGIGIQDGLLYVNEAASSHIKAGEISYRPIVPKHQHESVFYGLAKAAGDSTQSASSNAVGVYTNNAKIAIQNMLSVPSTDSPTFTGSFSHNRKANTTVGPVSAVIGYDNTAEGNGAIAIGYNNIACAQGSIALGNSNTIYGNSAVAIGYENIAQYQSSFVFGSYNAIDTITDWASNVEYDVGDLVYHNTYVLECLTAHTSGSTIDYSNWKMVLKYLFIIGNGNQENARSNALAVSIEGDLRLKNNLYVNCNADSSGGIRVPYDIQINSTSIVSNGIANIPIASSSTAGVIKIGTGFYIGDNTTIFLNAATGGQIKSGGSNYMPIVTGNQHQATFYGLAKAAGDTTQSASDNAVGTYTDSAKTAIKTMLDIPTLVSQLTNDSGFLTSVPTMTGATSSTAGASGLVPAPATTDVDKFLAGDGTYKSGGLPMVILSYGNSTWADFEAAYNNNVIVYCRASSNSNPKTGSQTRMAFMAYVNDSASPTNVEFQYYRSVNSHSSSQMGDQVFVYKLDKTSGWSVTTREASIKQIKADTGTALGVSWNSNVVTLTNTMTANEMPMSSSDATTVGEEIDALNSNQTRALVSGAGTSFTIPSNYRGRLVTIDSNTDRCGEWLIYATGAGTIGIRQVLAASLISLTVDTNKLTIRATDSGTPSALFDNIQMVAKVQ